RTSSAAVSATGTFSPPTGRWTSCSMTSWQTSSAPCGASTSWPASRSPSRPGRRHRPTWPGIAGVATAASTTGSPISGSARRGDGRRWPGTPTGSASGKSPDRVAHAGERFAGLPQAAGELLIAGGPGVADLAGGASELGGPAGPVVVAALGPGVGGGAQHRQRAPRGGLAGEGCGQSHYPREDATAA